MMVGAGNDVMRREGVELECMGGEEGGYTCIGGGMFIGCGIQTFGKMRGDFRGGGGLVVSE